MTLPRPTRTDTRAWRLLVLAALIPACGTETNFSGKPIVFASIAPLAGWAETIAGDGVEVYTLLPPASDHVQYAPTPSQLRLLSRASLYIRSGLPFENVVWTRIRAVNPSMKVVDMRDGLHLFLGDHGQGRENADPHTWLNPRNAVKQAEAIGAALAEILPARKIEITKRSAALAAELVRLDVELEADLQEVRGKGFWVYHPSWHYFAERYGMKQIAIQKQNKNPGMKSFAALIRRAKSSEVNTILIEPSLPRSEVEVIAKELGARLVTLDPFSKDYAANLREMAHVVKEAAS